MIIAVTTPVTKQIIIANFKISTSKSVNVCSNLKRGYVVITGKRKMHDEKEIGDK